MFEIDFSARTVHYNIYYIGLYKINIKAIFVLLASVGNKRAHEGLFLYIRREISKMCIIFFCMFFINNLKIQPIVMLPTVMNRLFGISKKKA